MNKTLIFFTFLVALSVSFFSPLYAGSHEKKADSAATETSEMAEEKKGKESAEVKEQKGDEDEEPECD